MGWGGGTGNGVHHGKEGLAAGMAFSCMGRDLRTLGFSDPSPTFMQPGNSCDGCLSYFLSLDSLETSS